MATRPTAQVLPRRRRALRLPRHLRRRVPRRWRAGLHQHPKVRRQIGVRTAWAKTRQILFAWWVWAIIAITALVYDNWGWAIGTGLMSAFSFLVWPREVPPRVGLEHEFSVDDDEFLTTIAGSTGIPFFEGNAHRDSQQRRRVLSGDAEGDRTGTVLDHDRGVHLLGGRYRQAVRSGARGARESGHRREDSARRSRLVDHRRRDSRNPRTGRVPARVVQPGAVCTASDASIIGRTASRSSSMAASRSPEEPASPITGWGTRRTAEHWRDIQIRIEGPAVMPLQTGFAQNWLQDDRRNDHGIRVLPSISRSPRASSRCRRFSARPRPGRQRCARSTTCQSPRRDERSISRTPISCPTRARSICSSRPGGAA